MSTPLNFIFIPQDYPKEIKQLQILSFFSQVT